MGGRVDSGGSESIEDDLSALAPPSPPPSSQRPEPGFFQRPVTPSPWEGRLVDSMFGSGDGDVAAMAPPQQRVAPTLPRVPAQDPTMKHYMDLGAKASGPEGKPLPETKAPKGPMLEGNIKGTSRPGTNSKTALPLYFAKAMGYAVPGASGDEEEARFAKAAHVALLKMTKGMTVAKFLASHQSPKTRDLFGKYLDAELRKGQQPVVNTPPQRINRAGLDDGSPTAATWRLK